MLDGLAAYSSHPLCDKSGHACQRPSHHDAGDGLMEGHRNRDMNQANELIDSLLLAQADTDSDVSVAAGRSLEEFVADDGHRRQSLKGFEDIYADIVHYIIRSTDRMWDESRGTDLINDHYAEDVPIHTTEGTVMGRDTVIEMTGRAKAAYPGIYLHGEDVVWSGDDQHGFDTSHRIMHMGTNGGPSLYGPATGAPVRRRALAHCRVFENRIVEEWLARDELAVVRSLGVDEVAMASLLGGQDQLNGRSNRVRQQRTGTAPQPGVREQAIIVDMLEGVWNGQDVSSAEHYYRPDTAIETCTDRSLLGSSGYQEYVSEWIDEFSDLELTIDHVMSNTRAGGELVAVRWWIDGSHSGDTKYGPPTGRRISLLGFSHFLVSDDQVLAEWTIFDEFALLKQIHGVDSTDALMD